MLWKKRTLTVVLCPSYAFSHLLSSFHEYECFISKCICAQPGGIPGAGLSRPETGVRCPGTGVTISYY